MAASKCALAIQFYRSKELCGCWAQNRFRNSTFLSSPGWLQIRKPEKGMLYCQKRRRCRAEFAHDAPFAVAIGACILGSLIFPLKEVQDKEGEKTSGDTSLLGAADVRYGTMSVISFIPLFNWLAWVFAWLDTSEQRYLFYSIAYLAPYIRTGFSLSPDDSWLPSASLIACIIHVQLEISVNTGGQEGMEFFKDATKFFSSKVKSQELQVRSGRLLDRLWQLAKDVNLLEAKVEELEFPSQQDFETELHRFDEKLATLERSEADEGTELLEKPKARELNGASEKSDDTERTT